MKILLTLIALLVATTAQAQITTVAHGGTGASTAAQARVNLNVPTQAVQTTDDTTSSLTLHNSATLTFAVGASQTWAFDVYAYVTSSTATGDKLAVSVPTGSTLVATAIETGSSAAVTNTEVLTTSATLGTSFVTASPLAGVVRIHGSVITSSTAGNVTVGFAKVTSGTATFKAGSCITYTRIK